MVGRTPEYLGKKIESYDVKMSMLYVLIFPLVVLTLAAVFVLLPVGLSATAIPARMGLLRSFIPSPPARATTAPPFAGLGPTGVQRGHGLGHC